MRILFLVPYPEGEAPSQRFRFEQYLEHLRDRRYSIKIQSFFSNKGWSRLYKPTKKWRKILDVGLGLLKRFLSLFSIFKYDFIFIHREVAPIGPPIFEWIIAKLMRKKIIYDFDDAIWLSDKTDEGFIEKKVRWRNKVGLICKWSYKVSCGNDYLAKYALRYNLSTIINPTTIDTSIPQKAAQVIGKVTIGWTGSHSTLKYLMLLEPVLQQLEKVYPNITLLVIADRKPDLNLKNIDFVIWNKKTEIEDLSKISIGIMPLPNNDWTKGKCGFKALQFMALGIPTIASSVGVNSKIIQNNLNGFLCSTDDGWVTALKSLIENEELRSNFSRLGKKTIEQHYSVTSNTSNFLSLFR